MIFGLAMCVWFGVISLQCWMRVNSLCWLDVDERVPDELYVTNTKLLWAEVKYAGTFEYISVVLSWRKAPLISLPNVHFKRMLSYFTIWFLAVKGVHSCGRVSNICCIISKSVRCAESFIGHQSRVSIFSWVICEFLVGEKPSGRICSLRDLARAGYLCWCCTSDTRSWPSTYIPVSCNRRRIKLDILNIFRSNKY